MSLFLGIHESAHAFFCHLVISSIKNTENYRGGKIKKFPYTSGGGTLARYLRIKSAPAEATAPSATTPSMFVCY